MIVAGDGTQLGVLVKIYTLCPWSLVSRKKLRGDIPVKGRGTTAHAIDGYGAKSGNGS
jgi:hypothetical protein